MNNPLTDLIPARYRKYLYALAFVAAFIYGLYEANGHDWKRTIGAAIGAVLAALAHSNTPAPETKGEAGTADVGLILLVLTFVGVVLLLFRVHFGG